MRLTKHHGFGNDFLIVLDETNESPIVADGQLARRLCDRHIGVGADGLIHGSESDDPDVDVVMVLHNSDGSRAEISGNGIRCLAQAVADARQLEAGVLQIATDGGRRSVSFERAVGATRTCQVDMGSARYGPAIPDGVREAVPDATLISVSIGNPHLIVVPQDPHPVAIEEIGPRLEAWFDEGINVQVITARPSSTAATIAVWERGAGATQACGSGASATAWALRYATANGPDPSSAAQATYAITMPGGTAQVVVGDTVVLGGPATKIADVCIDQPTGA